MFVRLLRVGFLWDFNLIFDSVDFIAVNIFLMWTFERVKGDGLDALVWNNEIN